MNEASMEISVILERNEEKKSKNKCHACIFVNKLAFAQFTTKSYNFIWHDGAKEWKRARAQQETQAKISDTTQNEHDM